VRAARAFASDDTNMLENFKLPKLEDSMEFPWETSCSATSAGLKLGFGMA